MSRKRRTVADEPFMVVRTSTADLGDGGEIAPHTHDWHQLIHVRSGLMTVRTDVGTWVAPPSWAVWVPAGIRHAIRFIGHSTLRTCYLRPEHPTSPAAPARHESPTNRPRPERSASPASPESTEDPANPPGRGSQDQSARAAPFPTTCGALAVSPLLRELILRATTIGMLDSRVPAEAAIATLIAGELGGTGRPPFVLPQPTGTATLRAAELITEGSPAGTATLARAVGVSPRTLERRFHTETGLTLGRWRQQHLLLRGLEHLAAGAPTTVASTAAGYNSPSAFIAAFRKTFGATPSRYVTPP